MCTIHNHILDYARTSLFVGCTLTSIFSGGKTIEIYIKGLDALGSVAA